MIRVKRTAKSGARARIWGESARRWGAGGVNVTVSFYDMTGGVFKGFFWSEGIMWYHYRC